MIYWFRNLFRNDKYRIGQAVKLEVGGDLFDVEILDSFELGGVKFYDVRAEMTVTELNLDWDND